MPTQVLASAPRRQSGASAIEFAFILPLLLALTYATVTYSYVFVIYESINYAAQLGAEAAVQVDPAQPTDDYKAAVTDQVQRAVGAALSWLPDSQLQASVGQNGSNVTPTFCNSSGGGGQYCPTSPLSGTSVVVPINFPLGSLFAVLTLPGIGKVPPLPDSLRGVGFALLSGDITAAPGG